MLYFLNRHLMHPLMAWRERSRHLDFLRYLRQTQFAPSAVVRARQLAALKAAAIVTQFTQDGRLYYVVAVPDAPEGR